MRDGRSFATRTVQARQRGKAIFTATMSFDRIVDEAERKDKRKLEHASRKPNIKFPSEKLDDGPLGRLLGHAPLQAVRDVKITGGEFPSDIIYLECSWFFPPWRNADDDELRTRIQPSRSLRLPLRPLTPPNHPRRRRSSPPLRLRLHIRQLLHRHCPPRPQRPPLRFN